MPLKKDLGEKEVKKVVKDAVAKAAKKTAKPSDRGSVRVEEAIKSAEAEILEELGIENKKIAVKMVKEIPGIGESYRSSDYGLYVGGPSEEVPEEEFDRLKADFKGCFEKDGNAKKFALK